jgi:hypothetical protein
MITIENDTIKVTSPEGVEMAMKVCDFVRAIAPERIDTRDLVLPSGTRSFQTRGRLAILIHETAPRVCNFKWIDENSPVPFGEGAVYRQVKIALPYVLVYAVFEQRRGGAFRLSALNECFFANEPLVDLDQKLFFPALLNCSRFDPPEGRPLSWICTQHLRQVERPRRRNRNRQLHAELKSLLHCLFETGFNYSSEHHEAESWFTASAKADPRIASIDAWKEATEKDRMCALDISWLPTGLSAGQIADRIFNNAGSSTAAVNSSEDIERIVFNHGQSESPMPEIAMLLDSIV